MRHLSLTGAPKLNTRNLCGVAGPAWHFTYMHPTQWYGMDICVDCIHIYAIDVNEDDDMKGREATDS